MGNSFFFLKKQEDSLQEEKNSGIGQPSILEALFTYVIPCRGKGALERDDTLFVATEASCSTVISTSVMPVLICITLFTTALAAGACESCALAAAERGCGTGRRRHRLLGRRRLRRRYMRRALQLTDDTRCTVT